MSLKPESFDIIKNELLRRAEKIPQVLGLDAVGINAADLGITEEFVSRLITEAYLGIFTTDEVEEMVAFQQKFADRNLILEKVIEQAFAKVLEENKESLYKKLEGAQ
uniref:Uncharacterized protein n=1 Tax=Salmonella phage vB_SEnST11_KE23 TaxID=3161174 RepID=A0AAU8GGH2_9CAUD